MVFHIYQVFNITKYVMVFNKIILLILVMLNKHQDVMIMYKNGLNSMQKMKIK